MEFLSEKIGETRERTAQGYLVLRDVPIARTGTMLYAAGEVPVTPGADGIICIERTPDVVFHPDTIKSFQGLPVVIEHPEDDVDPTNWKRLTIGVLLDVRQGTGIEDNLLLADLLITDQQAIEGIESETYHEVSAGYDAAYEDDGDGRGHQTSIRGNHLALLSGAGRCGPVCSIGDSASPVVLTNDASQSGATNRMTKFIDSIRAAFKAKDEKALEATLAKVRVKDEEAKPENEGSKLEVKDEAETGAESRLSELLDRIAALEAKLNGTTDGKPEDEKEETADAKDDGEDEDEAESETADCNKDKKSRDAASLKAEISDVFARAEILSPGIKLPTYDTKADPKKTRDSLCVLRRKALRQAYTNDKTRDSVAPFVGANPNFKTLDCAAMKAAFIGASELLKRSNNVAPQTRDGMTPQAKIANQIAVMNKANAEFWARNK